MIRINSQYPTKVKFVKHKANDRGAFTTFSIGDKVKDSDPAQYQNYGVTVFDDLPINDGDEITITSIESISSRVYNGKVFTDLVVKVDTSKMVRPAHEEPDWGNSEKLPFAL